MYDNIGEGVRMEWSWLVLERGLRIEKADRKPMAGGRESREE